MYILGITSFAHESSCALIKDGQIRFLIEEERLNREKHTWNYPFCAIEACLTREGISMDDVDHITFFWQPYREIIGNIGHIVRYFHERLKGDPWLSLNLWFLVCGFLLLKNSLGRYS